MTKKEIVFAVLLSAKKATKRMIAHRLNEIGFDNYTNWQIFDINGAVNSLEVEGKVRSSGGLKGQKKIEKVYEVVG